MSNENNNPQQEKEVTAMPTKKYYETVDVATGELPEVDGYYVTESKWIGDGGLVPNDRSDTEFINGHFLCGQNWEIISWLRPVSLSELIREDADLIEVSKGRYPIVDEDMFDDTFMDYEEYMNEQEECRSAFLTGCKYIQSLIK